MDKMTFASYKFKASDVIEGLNRYFAETKAFRYLRASLEIRRGVCFNNPDCVKDIIFGNNPPERATKAWCCWHYYLVCDPEEVVGVAINWLREEHDIFYTPWMRVPVEDFDVDEAAKEYEKETRKDLKETLQRRLHEAKRRIIALEAGHAEKSKIIDRQVARIRDLEKELAEKDTRIKGLEADIAITNRSVKEQTKLRRRLADIRKAAGMADGDPTDLVKYVEALREKAEENSTLRGNLDYFADLAQGRLTELSNLRYEILKIYREIFDCSNGDPEGSDEETMQDILTEYKRCLELKDAAEEKTAKYKTRLDNAERQLRWTEEVNKEWLKKYEKLKSELNEMKELYRGAAVGNGGLCEDLAKEKEWTKKLEQKLIEIQDICER